MTLRAAARRLVPRPARAWLRSIRTKVAVVNRYGGLRRAPVQSLVYLAANRETTNFTYDIANRESLAVFIDSALGLAAGSARRFIDELDDDRAIRQAIRRALGDRSDRNRDMPFGRRLGWYAVIRAQHPKVVVETGVHDGLGSIAILRALDRNAAQGFDGRLISFDVNPRAGWLIPSSLRKRHDLVIGDSLAFMPSSVGDRTIDVFIHDSNHSFQHESSELELASAAAVAKTVFMSDNAHATTALRDFATEHGLQFSFWQEHPTRHFYPGAGIGLARNPTP